MPPKVKKTVYSKKDPISHILDRPDTWVGSLRRRNQETYVVIDENYHIGKRTINISPALERMLVEPLSNVVDNVARSKKNKNPTTKISIEIKDDTITFWNDGDIVAIEQHPEEKCYNHTLIFGQLLTGSNYDDEEDREDISGRNGIGIKAVNVYSTFFQVEGLDPENGKKFSQIWTNNMRTTNGPVVSDTKLKKGWTRITYKLDFERFGIDGYTEEILSLYKKLIVDSAMITKIPVFLNDEEIPVKNLSDYAKLYSTEEITDVLSVKTSDCDVVLTPSNEFESISFANGICTPLGGTHVDAWSEAFFRPLVEKLNKKGKPQLNIGDVKKFFRLFVIASVRQPKFDSQSKMKLEEPIIEADVKKTHIAKICKWSVLERLEDVIRAKEMLILKKTERKKRGYEKVDGLDPSNIQGVESTIIFVEGLSAKTYASWGIQRGAFGKKGRDYFAIYSLRGKLLNCRNAKALTISKNNVISDIIKAIGLQYDVDYTKDENYNKLRYGRILVITDADVDGIHILSLLLNMVHALFPSLLQRKKSFMTSMQTPIVRVYLGKQDILFYDEQEYRKYVQSMKEKGKINKKYYKGLGSSNEEDVAETFGKKLIEFKTDEKILDTMNKAFHTKYADMRKEWLQHFDPDDTVLNWKGAEQEMRIISCSDFINTELIKFSIDDCKRSIPHLLDGLKEGHRKVLYTTFLRKLSYKGKTIKVAQLAGAVSEKSGYHHGEQNLHSTITHMAAAHVGSNNIPLLYRDGQFGSRDQGGKDAANGRYIWTKLDALTRNLFSELDDVLLERNEDDGDVVEPRFYVPIIPMVLVNGVIAGIGTGWSCSIPCYNPLDLIASIRVWLEHDGNVYVEDEAEDEVIIEEDEDANAEEVQKVEQPKTTICLLPHISPWYREHTGEMTQEEDGKYTSWGRVSPSGKNEVIVDELPVGLWTSDFTEILETMKEEKQIAGYKNHSTPKVINYTIKKIPGGISCDETSLKLTKTIRTSNMVLFTEKGTLKKFNTVQEIIDAFCIVRYGYYTLRKNHILSELKRTLTVLGNKKRFLEEIRDGKFKLFEMVDGKRQSRKTVDIVKELDERKYDKDPKNSKDIIENEDAQSEEDNEEEKENTQSKSGDYDYLLKMSINSITAERINKLQKDILSTQQQYEDVFQTTEKQMWISELDTFEELYKKWLVVMASEKVKKTTKK